MNAFRLTRFFLSAAAAICAGSTLSAQQATPPAVPAAPAAKPVAKPAAAPVAKPAAVPAAKPVAAPTAAPVAAPVVAKRAPEKKRYFMSIGPGMQFVSPDGEFTSDYSLYGSSVALGLYFHKTNPLLKFAPINTFLTLDVGYYYGDYTNNIPVGNYTPGWLPPGDNYEIHSTLSRKVKQGNLPVLFTFAFEFDIGDSFHARLGPTLGITSISAKVKYNASNSFHFGDGTVVGPVPEQLVGTYDDTGSTTIFTYGLAAGVTWDITQRLRADFQYRLTTGDKIRFAGEDHGTAVAHQLNFSIGWRF
ncbi:MAG: outer membrane beta-barrel protein [Puniceicoccales bacterium]|jgi:opacity protein-like surface antigen|nr:outer membrane beta-barrel protein [Puniceicoccales bacterium]